MQKICFIFAITLLTMFFHTSSTAQSASAAMSSDEFNSLVQTQSQQTQTRINQQLQQILSNKAPSAQSSPPPAQSSTSNQGSQQGVTNFNSNPSQSGDNTYTGFGNAPSSSAPAPSSNSGSSLNIKY